MSAGLYQSCGQCQLLLLPGAALCNSWSDSLDPLCQLAAVKMSKELVRSDRMMFISTSTDMQSEMGGIAWEAWYKNPLGEWAILNAVLIPVKVMRTPHPKAEDDPWTISPEDQRARKWGGHQYISASYPSEKWIESGFNGWWTEALKGEDEGTESDDFLGVTIIEAIWEDSNPYHSFLPDENSSGPWLIIYDNYSPIQNLLPIFYRRSFCYRFFSGNDLA